MWLDVDCEDDVAGRYLVLVEMSVGGLLTCRLFRAYRFITFAFERYALSIDGAWLDVERDFLLLLRDSLPSAFLAPAARISPHDLPP